MSYHSAIGSQQIGKGNFTLPIVDRNGLTGKNLTLSDFLGKVIVLEFMGPWCPPCQRTVSVMERLYNQFAAQGVVFIAVVEPQSSHYPNVTMTQFLNNHTTSLTYVLERSNWQIATLYGVQSIPTLFILSKTGSVAATYTGSSGISDAESAIANIINAHL